MMHTPGLILLTAVTLLIPVAYAQQLRHPTARPNILWLVADDMNWDSPGCFGGVAEGVTPHIDRLAEEGIQFWHGYVNVAVCTPSRSVMLTGLYSQNNGAEGFQRIRPGTPTLPSLLNAAGFLCGTIGKPLNQQELFRWSTTYTWQGKGDENLWGRDPAIYRRFARDFFAHAKSARQPFFLMANTHDPHDPFATSGPKGRHPDNLHYERAESSKNYDSSQVRVSAGLPDTPEIRKHLARYAGSVRRTDDMVGAVLQELDRAGLADNTIVLFLSDHGMAFPGVKANCYPDSTRSPWIIRWPGVVAAGQDDRLHMLSCVDLQSTFLEVAKLSPATQTDGRSFLPILQGGKQEKRDYVFTQFFHIHGKDAYPMRGILSRDWAYLFNPWADGKRIFPRQWNGFDALRKAAQTNPLMQRRVDHLSFRTVEEFYSLREDPHCLSNLLGTEPSSPDNPIPVNRFREKLRELMIRISDPALPAFNGRRDPRALQSFMKSYTDRATKEIEELRSYEEVKGYRF
ncbi:MAG TPA: hypothetical protein DD438_12760 [Verrucomicrobiales bacterium]|nr:hypothetical protein [Verrucomicrobiales bacterium]